MSVFETLAPYRIVRGFLGEDLVEQLLAHAQAHRDRFTPAKVGYKEATRVDEQIRSSAVLRDLGPLADLLTARFRAIADWAAAEMKISPFSADHLEIQLVAHGDGAFFGRHIDTHMHPPSASKTRILTGVYYFHAVPKRFTGGALRLYPLVHKPGMDQPYQDIEVERDMLLLFPSWAPHEVRPVACPSGVFADYRFAINCWYCKARA